MTRWKITSILKALAKDPTLTEEQRAAAERLGLPKDAP